MLLGRAQKLNKNWRLLYSKSIILIKFCQNVQKRNLLRHLGSITLEMGSLRPCLVSNSEISPVEIGSNDKNDLQMANFRAIGNWSKTNQSYICFIQHLARRELDEMQVIVKIQMLWGVIRGKGQGSQNNTVKQHICRKIFFSGSLGKIFRWKIW